jgi:hypothetical protein
MFRELEERQEVFSGLGAHRLFDASLSIGDNARRETGFFVSGSYFSVLGVRPALGRLLGPEDDRVDGLAESVVLSHAYWQRELGGDPDVLGRSLNVNGTPLTIVGVAPRGFHGTTVGARAAVFVPITFRGVGSSTAIPNHDTRCAGEFSQQATRARPWCTGTEWLAATDRGATQNAVGRQRHGAAVVLRERRGLDVDPRFIPNRRDGGTGSPSRWCSRCRLRCSACRSHC